MELTAKGRCAECQGDPRYDHKLWCSYRLRLTPEEREAMRRELERQEGENQCSS